MHTLRHGRGRAAPRSRSTVEIPSGSRNKYEYDHRRHRFVLDRTLYSSVHYPCDYGFIEGSLAEDGDPLDVLVVIAEPTFPGCVVRARPIGVLDMADEKGHDYKILAVAHDDPRWESTGRARGPLAASAARDRELLPDLQDAREPADRRAGLARRSTTRGGSSRPPWPPGEAPTEPSPAPGAEGQSEGAVEEGRHLAAGDRVRGAEARRGAPAGDAGRRDAIDVVLEDASPRRR